MAAGALATDLNKIGAIIEKMADPDIFVWLGRSTPATESEIHRAATIVADRLCGAVANPIIRNAQENRQLAAIGAWLEARGYKPLPPKIRFDAMPPGTFSFRLNVPVKLEGTGSTINIPVDTVAMPKSAKAGELPLLIEAKSAGDFTNVNKRRKEEAGGEGERGKPGRSPPKRDTRGLSRIGPRSRTPCRTMRDVNEKCCNVSRLDTGRCRTLRRQAADCPVECRTNRT